jgi:hypothetical protein
MATSQTSTGRNRGARKGTEPAANVLSIGAGLTDVRTVGRRKRR